MVHLIEEEKGQELTEHSRKGKEDDYAKVLLLLAKIRGVVTIIMKNIDHPETKKKEMGIRFPTKHEQRQRRKEKGKVERSDQFRKPYFLGYDFSNLKTDIYPVFMDLLFLLFGPQFVGLF